MEVYPFIKEGVINIFPEAGEIPWNEKRVSMEVNYLYKRDLEYEGEGEEGTAPWTSVENSLKNSQKYF